MDGPAKKVLIALRRTSGAQAHRSSVDTLRVDSSIRYGTAFFFGTPTNPWYLLAASL